MLVRKFEDLFVWKTGMRFVVDIYKLFGNNKDFGFRDQILRASLSIVNNISEGFERDSNKEFKRFLNYSKASCAEVITMLYLANELKYIKNKDFAEIYNKGQLIMKSLVNLIKTININK